MRELCDMCLVCVRLGNQVDFCQYLSEARLAQSVEHETLNLRVVGSSPTLGASFFFSFFFAAPLPLLQAFSLPLFLPR